MNEEYLTVKKLSDKLLIMIEKDKTIENKPILISINDKSICSKAFVKAAHIIERFDWEQSQIRIEVDEPIIKENEWISINKKLPIK